MSSPEIIYLRPHQTYQLARDLQTGTVDSDVARTHGQVFVENEQRILDLLLFDSNVLLQFEFSPGSLWVPECEERLRKWHHCKEEHVQFGDEWQAKIQHLPIGYPISASIVFPFLIRK